MQARLAVLLLAVVANVHAEDREVKQQPELSKLARNWAEKLGGELWHFGELVTRRNTVIESFKPSSVEIEDGEAILKDIHDSISKMMQDKVKAVQRIMEVAENSAVAHGDKVDYNYDFYNAKNFTTAPLNCSEKEPEKNEESDAQEVKNFNSYVSEESEYNEHSRPRVIVEDGYQRDQEQEESIEESSQDGEVPANEELEVTDGSEQDPLASQKPPIDKSKLPLYCNKHFYNMPVNTNHSAVHVPSNVFERSTDVIRGIEWSEELDKTFRNNYKEDPTLSWQYFGSSTGFMRQFPAISWVQEPIDLFDCRTRSWYIEAASSPKDVIILVDRSGSMTGMRREIAKHVVHNILDTLGNNDYVNIFTFSNTTEALVPCFDKILVQANLANVRLFKESMSTFRTEQIANFSLALTTAFELLEEYRIHKRGAQCNQAIMLITDGVQYNYKDIFKKYNWQNLPFMPVRVFTYLIGREVSDVREVKWMACANQGYYVHLSTYAEVREEVLRYVPVMARPMVLNPTHRPNPAWSPVYADVTDPKLTNWLWVNRQRNQQREMFLMYRRNKTLYSPDEQDRKWVHQQKLKQDNYGELQKYRLMTSVSVPVYDRRENATRVANLLGVAGTDIPVENIQRLTLPYRLGVNGYAFIVTNNGYILIHPDLRPVFQGILKPSYNRVDMIEVEVMDDDAEPRNFSDAIKELRRKVVMQESGNITLKVKSHVDDMRRIILSTRHYFHMGLNGTPFSLVIALPHRYGFYRVNHRVEDDVHRLRLNDKVNPLTQFFTGNWTIHPDWHYCRYLDDTHNYETPEEELLHFLKKIEGPAWKWTKECDRKLVNNLVADAKITLWFNQNITAKEENGHELIKRFGITVTFLATHSGLTRWQDFPQNIDKDTETKNLPHFSLLYNRAIDEVWYKRAIEQHYVNPKSFIYSVPFEVGDDNSTLVTASHAIFREDGQKKAPAAVVGFQFLHSALQKLFNKITNNCGDIPCKRTCDSQELYCVMLDDNGFVIVSDDREDTGRFFGEIRPDIMNQLVTDGVYKPNRMYDYQATCFQSRDTGNYASKFLAPIAQAAQFAQWAIGTFACLINSALGVDIGTIIEPQHQNEQAGEEEDEEEEEGEEGQPASRANEKEFDQRLLIKKTKPEPCDQEMWLYTLVHYNDRNISSSGYNRNMTDNCTRPYIVQPVAGSNMILVVINNICPSEREPIKMPDPVEIYYNESLACYRVFYNNYTRRHYMTCINRHVNESHIKLCGKGTKSTLHPALLLLAAILWCVRQEH